MTIITAELLQGKNTFPPGEGTAGSTEGEEKSTGGEFPLLPPRQFKPCL